MNLHEVARRLWEERISALIVAVLAVVVAILITFHVSLSGPSLRPRALQLGVAQTSVLIDSHRSTIASTAGSKGLAGVTINLAELMNSQVIIAPIARALGVAPDNIGVQVQVSQKIPLSQSQPLEPQVGTEILTTRRHYYLVVHDISGGQIIGLYAQAPTGRMALARVVAAEHSLTAYVAAATHSGRVGRPNQIVVRQLGNVYGRTLDPHVSEDAAVLIAVLAWILVMIALITLKNQARRERSRPTPATAPS
jgi:hypothetical protein